MTARQRLAASSNPAIPRVGRLELDWLVGAEREAPFELPDRTELRRWYAFCLAAVAAAVLLAVIVHVALGLCRARSPRLGARAALWLGLLVFGVAATPLTNRFSSEFVFTWPVALFAVHQIVLVSVFWSQQPSGGRAAAGLGIAGAALLIVTCLVYYELTRQLSLAPAWYFLLTFLPIWPLAIPAARRLLRPASFAGDVAWTLVTFSAYFWASGGLMLWRSACR